MSIQSSIPLVLAIALAWPSMTQAETLVLNPTDDSFIRASSANQGSNNLLLIGDTTTANDYLRTCLAFDLSAPVLSGATINSVSLALTIGDKKDDTSPDQVNTLVLHEFIASFTNDGVTWTSRDGTNNWTSPGGDFGAALVSVAANAGTVSADSSFDFTSAALTTAGTNAIGGPLHLLVKLATEDAQRSVFRFGSVDYVGDAPTLTIEYQPFISDPLSITLDGPDQYSNLQIRITGKEGTPYFIHKSSDLTLPHLRWPVAFSGVFPASNQVDLVETNMTASQQFYVLSTASPIDALPETALDALALADEVITYKIKGEQEFKLHVYFPDDLQPGEQRPTLLFIHGGGWKQGDPSVHALESLYFSRRGLVTVTISYNLLPTNGTAEDPLECFADVKAAMRYLREHASELHINPDQIVSSGGSAGGHLAAALATLEADKTYAPNAMILLYPAFNLVDGWLEGGAICTAAGIDPAAFSPALHVDADTPPTLILAGSNDTISTPPTNRAFIESMTQLNNSAEFIEYTGKGHQLFTRDKTDPYFRATIYYMERFLKELGYLDSIASVPENIQITAPE